MSGGPGRTCVGCGLPISRYNPDTRCSTCARTDATPTIPDRAWRDEEVHRALAAWDFGTVVRLVRRRSGLSQKAVRELTGLTQGFISDLERGLKQVNGRETIIDLLTGLGLPADLRPLLLAPFAQPESQRLVEVTDPALPWTAARMVTSLEAAVGGAMTGLNRRSVIALGGAGLTQYILQAAVAPPEAIASTARNGISVSDQLLTSLQSTTDALRQADASHGSGNLARAATAHLKVLLRFLKEGHFNEATGRRLAAVTADTAIQTGWYHFDSGAHTVAHNLLVGALRAAHASGDSRLRAGALSFIAIHGYSAGDPRDAVTAARTARQVIADQDAPALHAMLLTRQARGHARLREDRQARTALEEAQALCARGRGEDDPHWLYWINTGEIMGQAGSCLLDLGRPDQAAQAFADARNAFSPDEIRTRAQFLSRAATAQMRAGDVDAGSATGHEVLALVSGVRSARLDDNLNTMLAEARRYSSATPAQELVERGQAVMEERAA
ncbi:helix-turn-helix domain-containing protein [Streptomyces sp. WAC08401]|uniref:helix-turn-helix domain-containing protein n=1 Tax=Streptomyces sp. WAC08401 TaxID=2487413 RepID=UPI000FB64A1A|nr:helix-turn-helix transcriptional regulator [Streptomyces sp. WAC08401]RSS14096.1 XRE family transcriptional regulator [Streptomyces sp. WAC08401]